MWVQKIVLANVAQGTISLSSIIFGYYSVTLDMPLTEIYRLYKFFEKCSVDKLQLIA
jgi:hypothetical protein